MNVFISKKLEETEKIAGIFLDNLVLSKNTATVIGLYGDLGSGKTTFTQAIGKILGISEKITSPTFVIQKKYKMENIKSEKNLQLKMLKTLIHADMYRLENGEETGVLLWQELLKNEENLVFVEWPEKIADVMPKEHIKVCFKFFDEQTREISF